MTYIQNCITLIKTAVTLSYLQVQNFGLYSVFLYYDILNTANKTITAADKINIAQPIGCHVGLQPLSRSYPGTDYQAAYRNS